MPARAGTTGRDARHALEAVERRLARYDRAVALTEWATYTGRGDARRTVRWQTARAEYLRSPERARLAARLVRDGRSDSLVRRGVLLGRAVLDAETEQSPDLVRRRARLQARIVRFRPLWNGRRVERAVVHEVLWRSTDRRERKRAWAAEEPLRRSLEPALRALVHRRNDLARSHGFRTYADLRLSFDQLTPSRVRALGRAAIAPLSRYLAPLRGELRERRGLAAWAPWDLHWAVERRAALPPSPFPADRMVATVGRALGAWGLPPRRRRFRLARCDIPFGGLTIAVEVPKDVRVLVHPRGGWEYYWVLLHEFGHAVHLSSVAAPSHLERTLEPGYAAFAEGIATVFEQLSDDPDWLASLPGIAPSAAQEFAQSRRSAPVFYAASYLLGLESELRLYDRPDRDPGPAVQALARRWLRYDPHPVGSWADPFRVTHPVYLQSYLLAYLFRAQVVEAMLRQTGRPLWPNPRAGPWLSESFFAPGARYDWMDRLREVTGQPLSAAPFVRSLGPPRYG